jgi:hypothetical protein
MVYIIVPIYEPLQTKENKRKLVTLFLHTWMVLFFFAGKHSSFF